MTLIATSCASSHSVADIDYPRNTGVPVLRLLVHNGFLNNSTDSFLPDVTVYGDGLVVSWDRAARPQRPSGLPFLRQRFVEPDVVARLVRQASVMLDPSFDPAPNGPGHDGTNDASTTYVELDTVSRRVVATAFALETADFRSADRRDLHATVESLQAIAGGGPYTPAGVAALAFPAPVPSGVNPPRPWPFLDLMTVPPDSTGMRCTIVGFDHLEEAIGVDPERYQLDWTSDTQTFAVWYWPLLPEEHGCDDVGAKVSPPR
jgi:hypothetical protein